MADGLSRDHEFSTADRPHSAVRSKCIHGHACTVKCSGAKHIAFSAGDISRLRVIWSTGLVVPVSILLHHHAQFTFRLTVAGFCAGVVGPCRVGTVTCRQVEQILFQSGLQAAADGKGSKRCVWNDITVIFTCPVDQAVAASVGNEYITSGTAVGNVLIGGFAGKIFRVRPVIGTTVGVKVVIGIEQVRAVAAVNMVLARSADKPVIAEVAEDNIIAVAQSSDRIISCIELSFIGIKVEQESFDLPPWIMLIIVGEFTLCRIKS